MSLGERAKQSAGTVNILMCIKCGTAPSVSLPPGKICSALLQIISELLFTMISIGQSFRNCVSHPYTGSWDEIWGSYKFLVTLKDFWTHNNQNLTQNQAHNDSEVPLTALPELCHVTSLQPGFGVHYNHFALHTLPCHAAPTHTFLSNFAHVKGMCFEP